MKENIAKDSYISNTYKKEVTRNILKITQRYIVFNLLKVDNKEKF